jgi:hypothetical protein
MIRLVAIAVLGLLFAAVPAVAQDATRHADAQGVECTCRAAGRVFRMGETVCLRTPSGDRIAVCEMVLNVTSWTPTSRACESEATQ